jgi:hypothetical protein
MREGIAPHWPRPSIHRPRSAWASEAARVPLTWPGRSPTPPTFKPPPSASLSVLLFCAASGTDWERAGITGTMVTATVIKGLIAREPTGGLIGDHL